jgi:hypothetical protein
MNPAAEAVIGFDNEAILSVERGAGTEAGDTCADYHSVEMIHGRLL